MPTPQGRVSPLPVLVLQGPGTTAWVRLLRASGASARSGAVGELDSRAAAVAPTGSVTKAADVAELLSWVHEGGLLVTADHGLLNVLGVRLDSVQSADGVKPQGGTSAVSWAASVQVTPVVSGPSRPVVRARSSGGAVLAATFTSGRGGLWALGVDPMGAGRDGHELLPGLGRAVAAWGRAPVGPARVGTEVYLDPGSLHGAARGTPKQLAARLQGVRAVHIAGWNGDFNNRADDYDYAALISALHARGILAYAWLEPPFVSLKMWEDHPECREKTQTGRDAHVDWRLLIALESPPCFSLATSVWDDLVTRYDWDGVNVAELYFEPAAVPADHTPFSPAALAQFGHDPLADSAGFLRFRTALATRLTAQVLANLNGLPGADHLDFEVTAIDDLLDRTFARQLGSSLRDLAVVARGAGASLQVEDPFTRWSSGPLRYDRLAPGAARLMPPGAVVVDLNVVDRAGAHPTSAMTGAELDLATGSAAAPSGRVAVYALGTLRPDDLQHLPGAAGQAAATTDTGVAAPWTTVVTAPAGSPSKVLDVDGQPWPVANGRAVVPAGEHALTWRSGPRRGPGLLSFSAELSSADVRPDGMSLTYSARPRAYAVLSCRTTSLELDGMSAAVEQLPDPQGSWALRLPPGTHRVFQRC